MKIKELFDKLANNIGCVICNLIKPQHIRYGLCSLYTDDSNNSYWIYCGENVIAIMMPDDEVNICDNKLIIKGGRDWGSDEDEMEITVCTLTTIQLNQVING